MKNTLPVKRRREIGGRVRAVRKSLKLEQTELAKKMGLSQAIISQYEGGMTEIPLSFIEYLKKKHRIHCATANRCRDTGSIDSQTSGCTTCTF